MDLLFQNEFMKPAGLGARDTLRLESGLCLHGHEIDDNITPVESLLQWTMRKKNAYTNYYGREAFLKRKKDPLNIKRVGVQLTKGGVLRENCLIYNKDQKEIGKLTSGTFSPYLKAGIGMGYVDSEYKQPDTELLIDIRGKKKEAKVVKLPFVPQRYYRGEQQIYFRKNITQRFLIFWLIFLRSISLNLQFLFCFFLPFEKQFLGSLKKTSILQGFLSIGLELNQRQFENVKQFSSSKITSSLLSSESVTCVVYS